MEYRLNRRVDPDDERLTNPVYYPPDAAEFSREEMQAFTTFFVGLLAGTFESLKRRWNDPFLLVVESNLILYGFDGETFFTRRFESPRRFERTRVALAERLPTPGFYCPDWERGETGIYRREIDYQQESPIPPLSAEQSAWATGVLAKPAGQ